MTKCLECEKRDAMIGHPSNLCPECYQLFKQSLRDGFTHEELVE